MGDHGQGFLFRVLEATDEQQKVLLLINQGFSKALCSQITQVQLFHLKEKEQRNLVTGQRHPPQKSPQQSYCTRCFKRTRLSPQKIITGVGSHDMWPETTLLLRVPSSLSDKTQSRRCFASTGGARGPRNQPPSMDESTGRWSSAPRPVGVQGWEGCGNPEVTGTRQRPILTGLPSGGPQLGPHGQKHWVNCGPRVFSGCRHDALRFKASGVSPQPRILRGTTGGA